MTKHRTRDFLGGMHKPGACLERRIKNQVRHKNHQVVLFILIDCDKIINAIALILPQQPDVFTFISTTKPEDAN